MPQNEIFRAARDAHRVADLLLALEHCKTMEQALAHINNSHSSLENQTINNDARIIPPMPTRDNSPELEMEM
jgi:hypothetical protein